MTRRPRPGAVLAFVAGGTAATSTAFAHGLAPSITTIAATSNGSPVVLTVSEGLAQRRAERLHFVCPIQFGSEASPPALSVDGVNTLVIGTDDLFTLLDDGTVRAQGRPQLSRLHVLGLAAVNDALHVYRLEGGNAQVVPLEPPGAPPIWTDEGPYDSFSPAGDGFWLSRVEGTRARLVRVNAGDGSTAERSFTVDAGSIIGRVVESSGTLYVGVISQFFAGSVVRLNADGASRLVEASAAVQGPVALATGEVFIAAEAELIELGTGVPTRLAGTEATCVGRLGELSYLCSRTKLWSLTPAGPSALLADLADLQPPDLEKVDPDKRGDCELQWRVFEGDLRSAGVLPAPATERPDAGDADAAGTRREPASGSCTVARHRRHERTWAAMVVAVAFACLARSRRGLLRG